MRIEIRPVDNSIESTLRYQLPVSVSGAREVAVDVPFNDIEAGLCALSGELEERTIWLTPAKCYKVNQYYDFNGYQRNQETYLGFVFCDMFQGGSSPPYYARLVEKGSQRFAENSIRKYYASYGTLNNT